MINLLSLFFSVLHSCKPNPCLNNAACIEVDGKGKFECQCTEQFRGAICNSEYEMHMVLNVTYEVTREIGNLGIWGFGNLGICELGKLRIWELGKLEIRDIGTRVY